MLQIYKQSAYVSKLEFYFGHFLLIVNAYPGGPRTQIFKGRRGGGGGGGGQFFPGDGVPTAHSYRNPLSLMIFQGGGRGSGPPPPKAPFLHTQRWSGPEQ